MSSVSELPQVPPENNENSPSTNKLPDKVVDKRIQNVLKIERQSRVFTREVLGTPGSPRTYQPITHRRTVNRATIRMEQVIKICTILNENRQKVTNLSPEQKEILMTILTSEEDVIFTLPGAFKILQDLEKTPNQKAEYDATDREILDCLDQFNSIGAEAYREIQTNLPQE